MQRQDVSRSSVAGPQDAVVQEYWKKGARMINRGDVREEVGYDDDPSQKKRRVPLVVSRAAPSAGGIQ